MPLFLRAKQLMPKAANVRMMGTAARQLNFTPQSPLPTIAILTVGLFATLQLKGPQKKEGPRPRVK